MNITTGDKQFLRKALKYFNIGSVALKYKRVAKAWPDVWVNLGNVPVITVTNVWAAKKYSKRRSELVHECLHISGLRHGKVGRHRFSTYPELDEFSKVVYHDIMKGGKWSLKKFR